MKYVVLTLVAGLGAAAVAHAQTPTYRQLFDACEKGGQAADARIAACDQALAQASPNATADRALILLARSDAHLAAKHVEAAIADADASSRLMDRYLATENQRCWIRAISNKDLVVARQACDTALDIQSNEPAVRDTNATLALQEGNWQLAWNEFNYAFRGGIPGAVYGRGLAALALGRPEAEADLKSGAAAKADFDSYGLTQASVKARAAAAPPVKAN